MRKIGDFSSDYDVGGRGISGHYDTMLGRLQGCTTQVMLTILVWTWIVHWPPNMVLLRIGPVLTVVGVFLIFVLLWTVRVWSEVAIGLWYGWRWLKLERRGLLFVIRNDHMLRVIYYRVEDDHVLYDSQTQKARRAQEVSANRKRRAKLFKEARTCAYEVFGLILVLFAIIAFPYVVGPGVMNFIAGYLRHANLDELIGLIHDQTSGDPTGQLIGDTVTHWLNRPDVRFLLTGYNVLLSLLALMFFTSTLPSFFPLGWTAFDALVHISGAVFIPGARVREEIIPETTLDTLRAQGVHGNVNFADPEEGARQMSE